MRLGLKFNLMMTTCLFLGLGLFSALIYFASLEGAREQLHAQISVLRAQALAVRAYTSDEIRPLLSDTSDAQFLPQTVPSFSAQTVFARFQEKFPNFYYKEATLNPTNPSDKAVPWEQELIEKLRADPTLTEASNTRESPNGTMYTVAYPIVIKSEACLTCHSTPEKAPASMIALYGKNNGFGWKLGETIGAQIISAPMSIANSQAMGNTKILIGATSAIFICMMLIINQLLNSYIISPVRKLSEVAERVSMGDFSEAEYVHPGQDEISALSQSFNRMQRSLDNAMKMIES